MTLAIAHRGDPVNQRENTMAAFAAAVGLGADMVELDLQCTRDGAIVVLHDPTLNRLWNVDLPVASLELADVQKFGRDDTRIPTLTQVLAGFDVPLMVDFTGPDVVDQAWADVVAAGAVERSLFVSGHAGALRQLRAQAPAARIGLTWTKAEDPDLGLLNELGAEFWNPMFRLATPERVATVHDRGLKVSCWTVDNQRHLDRVRRAGVDAIVSNRIADLRHFLARAEGNY
jgi:glycerophosphoryl diester phosphodiesterase